MTKSRTRKAKAVQDRVGLFLDKLDIISHCTNDELDEYGKEFKRDLKEVSQIKGRLDKTDIQEAYQKVVSKMRRNGHTTY